MSCIYVIYDALYSIWYSVPAAAPQNFTAIGISGSSVKLQWDPPIKKSRNGESAARIKNDSNILLVVTDAYWLTHEEVDKGLFSL